MYCFVISSESFHLGSEHDITYKRCFWTWLCQLYEYVMRQLVGFDRRLQNFALFESLQNTQRMQAGTWNLTIKYARQPTSRLAIRVSSISFALGAFIMSTDLLQLDKDCDLRTKQCACSLQWLSLQRRFHQDDVCAFAGALPLIANTKAEHTDVQTSTAAQHG